MKSIASTLATVWRIAVPYFRSEDKWAGRGLLAAVIAIELVVVAIEVLLNQWRGRFYNALQERNFDAFVSEMIFFCVLAAVFIALAVYQLYLNQWLQIRWRRWMTQHYLGDWLHGPNHYRMQLQGDAADNPDQRLTDDVRLFIERTLVIGIGILSSFVSLVSFIIILWGLSASAPLHLFGTDFDVPGYLVLAALVYAIIGTVLTHWIGSPLAALNFEKQAVEADFRFNLVRVRESGEQIALLRGEAAEKERLSVRFGRVTDNWMRIMTRTKRLTAFTASYSQASVVFPYILTAPAYFANKMQLGGLMQTASAFSSVQSSLSFFVTAYRDLAEWRSIVDRLDGFEAALAGGEAAANNASAIQHDARDPDAISLKDLAVRLPGGQPLVAADAFSVRRGERVLVTGPSGSGKSTLFRAIAGIWPFGQGTVSVPAGAKVMMLPQRPYFPVGPLRAAVTYPATDGAYTDDALRGALTDVGLPALAARLDEHGHWNRMLSLGEQQRLGIARALLFAPDYLFLDEATASLDEPAEAMLYRLLQEKLPAAALVSIGHRSTLEAFHGRKASVARSAESFRLAAAPAPAIT